MNGVAKNLAAMLDDKFHAEGRRDSRSSDAPLAEALAMMVRERLTGQAPPPQPRRWSSLWRSYIEGVPAANSIDSGDMVEDQREFCNVIHDCHSSIWARHAAKRTMSRQRTRTTTARTSGENSDAAETDNSEQAEQEQADAPREEMTDSAPRQLDAPIAEMPDDFEMGDIGKRQPNPAKTSGRARNEPRGPRLPAPSRASSKRS